MAQETTRLNARPAMSLAELLADLPRVGLPQNYAELAINSMALDSRAVCAGSLYLAVNGTHQHGLNYLPDALARGAAAVLYDPENASEVQLAASTVPCIAVTELSAQAGELAAKFYAQPSRQLSLIGVTGTDGKTSCAWLAAQALQLLQGQSGLSGTLGAGNFGSIRHTGLTTPDAVTVQAWLSRLLESEVNSAVMEVSSHGLAQGRVNGLQFDTAVLTNLGRDHLDYHQTLDAYKAAKAKLFNMPGLRHVVINADDEFGRELIAVAQASDVSIYAYSLTGQARALAEHAELNFIEALDVSLTADGSEFRVQSNLGESQVKAGLLGNFNVSNLLATLGVLLAQAVDFEPVCRLLEALKAAPGRMECFSAGDTPKVVVDYAHTPQALEQVLKTLRSVYTSRLVTVMGCGGDRDKGKRPLMGEVASRYSDAIVVTTDNPRSEDPAEIARDIRAGIQIDATVVNEPDRKAAIVAAIAGSLPKDVVLIAGKGHEDYQIIGNQVLPLSDRDIVSHALHGRPAPRWQQHPELANA